MIKERITIGCEAFRSDFTVWSDNTYTERVVFFNGGEAECVREKQYASLTEWKNAIKQAAEIAVLFID